MDQGISTSEDLSLTTKSLLKTTHMLLRYIDHLVAILEMVEYMLYEF